MTKKQRTSKCQGAKSLAPSQGRTPMAEVNPWQVQSLIRQVDISIAVSKWSSGLDFYIAVCLLA